MSGPQPRYVPKFTEAAIEYCRQIVRQRHAPHTQVQRARLALALAEAPSLSVAKLARRLGVGTSFVWIWKKRWSSGPFTLEDLPRPGRPPRGAGLDDAIDAPTDSRAGTRDSSAVKGSSAGTSSGLRALRPEPGRKMGESPAPPGPGRPSPS